MDLGIAGKVAFVSGGSKGIGRSTAEILAREGCRVVIAARGQAAIDATVAAITAAGGTATGVCADLTERADVERAVTAGTEAFGPPDIAVANVHGPGPGNFFDLSDTDFAEAFRRMTLSMVYLARAVVPHMREQGWGRAGQRGVGRGQGAPAGAGPYARQRDPGVGGPVCGDLKAVATDSRTF
jgi:3-oxoacyl-[acyl-carrier protein] reductase